MKLLVTGGLGFIGSNFIRYLLEKYPTYSILNLDAKTYSGNPDNLADLKGEKRYRWVWGDITDPRAVQRCMGEVQAIVHFAAESHVDRSILSSGVFVKTNVLGTQVLLEAAKNKGIQRFIHVSTDEVYGSVEKGTSREEDPLRPNSPYAASKAASDLIVRSYGTTYGLPVLITRSSNNFGPYQYPEKVLPLFITNALEDAPLPLYGSGQNVRDWIYVTDHCRALDLVLHRGRLGETYNLGGTHTSSNRELVHKLLEIMGKPASLIRTVADRPAHDLRYALNSEKIQKELGWKPECAFEEALRRTVEWYRTHRPWWEKIKKLPRFKRYYQKQYPTLKPALAK
ncbi:MAG: dTDP-glucose 4,6-dehydratase [Elusimicrobia bacterium]|nr:dTDP-glucose 4,6-dehydratase [Elusimicrobiota bacterium]